VFRVTSTHSGRARLSDGCRLGFRVAIVELREHEILPTGPQFLVGVAVRVYVESCPDSVRKLVEGKPAGLTQDAIRRLDIWELVDLEEVEPAFEECEYKASDGRTYTIHVELEPTIAARTLEYRDPFGNPVYFVRWARKDAVRVKKQG